MSEDQTAITATLMRGGSSKGLYFISADLPENVALRNAVLLAALGSPDDRQIDGIGGAHPLTSKVAIISPSEISGIDVDYLFLQIKVDEPIVSEGQNCGNILAGVGPFAIENNLLTAKDGQTDVSIRMVNSGALAIARVQTPNRQVAYQGTAKIDGVPGHAAPILLDFKDLAGSSCGSLLPTKNVVDEVDGINVTCIDNGMPVVVMQAADFGKTGEESPAELEADLALAQRIESMRLTLGLMMNLGDVTHKTVPKMTLVAAPKKGGTISTQSFIPHRVHEAIGVLAATTVAAACLIPCSVAHKVANTSTSQNMHRLEIEHPSGSVSVDIELSITDDGVVIHHSALLRTARKIMQGQVFVPTSLFESKP
mgnify:CR=1 FL=1